MLWAHDPDLYTTHAREWAAGRVVPAGSPAAHRIGLIESVALSYRLFGVGEWVGSIFILLCAVGFVAAGQAAAAATFGPRDGLVAGVLLAMSPLTVLFSLPIMGEMPVAFASAPAMWASAGLALGIGYWFKETVVIVAVVVLLRSARATRGSTPKPATRSAGSASSAPGRCGSCRSSARTETR